MISLIFDAFGWNKLPIEQGGLIGGWEPMYMPLDLFFKCPAYSDQLKHLIVLNHLFQYNLQLEFRLLGNLKK